MAAEQTLPEPAQLAAWIDAYARGVALVQQAAAGLSADQLRQPAEPGRWSVLEVVCHLADFEIVGADRIKSTIAESRPVLPGRDENLFAARLAVAQRDLANELQLIAAIRQQVVSILQTLPAGDWLRVGLHSSAGELTVADLVQRMTRHIEHHVEFIEQKRVTLLGERRA